MGHSPVLDSAGRLSAAAMARVGMRVGDYEIKGVIGEGGTGVVYRGRHVASDKPVAIKILHDRGSQKKDVVEQFIGEARATSRIRHPNVIDVDDLGTTPDGTVFVAMEYLEGESLWSRLRQVQRLPLFEAINILRQVARGLGAAHEAGIVHGGLKPADIFLCRRKGRRRIVRRSKAQGMRLVVEPEESFDLVKLLDFGMARFLDLAPGEPARAGAVSSTLHYLSPEQAQGQPADQRSDVYSLGAVFYEMVTGTVPFGGESLLDILRGHVSGQVIAPSRRTPGAGIHMRIDELILKCLKKNPTLRFASTGELCEALDACVTDCAFLRDAHRLPGIAESGIDLSEASPEARQDGARSAEEPATAPVAEKPAVATVAKKPALASVAEAPVLQKPATVSVAKKPAAAPIAEKPSVVSVPHKLATAPVGAKTTSAPVGAKPSAALFVKKPTAAPAVAKSTATLFAERRATAPVVAKPMAAPVAEQSATAPVAQASAKAPTADDPTAAVKTPLPTILATVDDPAAAVKTPPPTILATADDPAAAVKTPPPAILATADDPAAAVKTPPPALVAADLSVESPAGVTDQPSWRTLERPEAIISDLEERPERFVLEAGSRRPRVIALVGVLLLGGAGIAVWAARSGSLHSTTRPVVASPPPPAPTPAPSPPQLAADPVAVAAAPVAPAPTPAPSPPPQAAAPVAAPAAPAAEEAAAPAAVLPREKTAAPAKLARATAHAPGKLASSRTGRVRPNSARPKPPVAAAKTATAPALAAAPVPPTAAKAKLQPESEPPTPSTATAASASTTAASATVDDLVREAQLAWMRGHHTAAIGKAQAVLKAKPKPAQVVQAYEIIATCSCALGQADTAREAASHLSDTRRELVKAVCKRNGVTIE